MRTSMIPREMDIMVLRASFSGNTSKHVKGQSEITNHRHWYLRVILINCILALSSLSSMKGAGYPS